jgi:hypothetical protein
MKDFKILSDLATIVGPLFYDRLDFDFDIVKNRNIHQTMMYLSAKDV